MDKVYVVLNRMEFAYDVPDFESFEKIFETKEKASAYILSITGFSPDKDGVVTIKDPKMLETQIYKIVEYILE